MTSDSHAHGHDHHQHSHQAPPPRPERGSGASHARPPSPAGGREHAGHDRHAGHSVEMFRDRFWITLALTIPTLVWSEMIQGWLRFTAPAFPGSDYIPPVFGTAVYLYGGWVFLAGGLRELRDRLPGMMTLISLAISVAFFFSLAVALGYPGESLWWELATLVTIMLLGHWIEMRSIFQASGALKELDRTHGEIKSMRTPAVLRRRGAGRAILAHILAEARARGYRRLSLETGAMPEFIPARKLYESFGFVYCGPFAPYKDDPYSVFMTLELGAALELGAGLTVSVRPEPQSRPRGTREPKP